MCSSFRVRRARLDIYRSPGNSLNGGKDLPHLEGIEAYFNEAGQLLQAVGTEGNGMTRDLFNECINGMIQAETYVYEERGFPSPRAYEEFWEQYYSHSCRFYTHLGRTTHTWYRACGRHTAARGTCSTAIRAAPFTGSRTAPWWPRVVSAIPFTNWGYSYCCSVMA